MEQQVHEAALAMVRATTDRSTRSAASNFLEQWTRTPESWEVYVKWLRSFDLGGTRQSGAPGVPPPDEALGTQLLCLTLLVAKIRREVTRQNPPPAADSIRNEIWSLLSRQQQQQQQSSSLSSPQDHSTSGATSPLLVGALCGCMAALTARDGHLAELVQTCCGGGPSVVSLRLLANIPLEVEACGELATSEVTAELWPHIEKVLDTVRRALVANDEQTAKPAMEALRYVLLQAVSYKGKQDNSVWLFVAFPTHSHCLVVVRIFCSLSLSLPPSLPLPPSLSLSLSLSTNATNISTFVLAQNTQQLGQDMSRIIVPFELADMQWHRKAVARVGRHAIATPAGGTIGVGKSRLD